MGLIQHKNAFEVIKKIYEIYQTTSKKKIQNGY
jgi:hypothetical protein